MPAAVLYPAARKPSAPAADAAITRPAVEGPPAIGATTTGQRAKRGSKSDPAMEPHPGYPGGERDGLPGEDRIQVVEVRDDGEQVAADHRGAGHPAVRPGTDRAEDQAQAQRDRDDEERV